MWKVFCQSVVTSILRNRNFWDSLRFPLVFLTTKACKAPTNGTHTSKGHLLKISLNHTLDSALLVEGFAKIVPVFNLPALWKIQCNKLMSWCPLLQCCCHCVLTPQMKSERDLGELFWPKDLLVESMCSV